MGLKDLTPHLPPPCLEWQQLGSLGPQFPQVPPNQAPQSSCVGITNLLRTGAPVYKNSAGPATVLPPIL